MTNRIFKGPETELGREIRAAALVYQTSGQADRAEGMRQAADMVDELTARGVATSVQIGFGPHVYIQWPSLEVAEAKNAWASWDVWVRRGHVQESLSALGGSRRLASGVSLDRACEIAKRAMDMSPEAACREFDK